MNRSDANIVYALDENSSTYPTVSAPSAWTDGSNWTIQWYDAIGDATAVTKGSASASANYTLTELGKHEVFFKAEYTNDTTITMESTHLTFYVIDENKTTISTTEYSYTGSPIEVGLTKNPSTVANPSYSYVKDGDATVNNGTPTEVGNYKLTAIFAEDLDAGLKELKITDKAITISKAKVEPDAGTTPVAKANIAGGAQETEHSIDLSTLLSTYGALTGTVAVGDEKDADFASTPTYDDATKSIKFTLSDTAAAGDDVTLTATLTNTNYDVTVTAVVSIKAYGTTIKTLSLTPIEICYNDYTTAGDWETLEKEYLYQSGDDDATHYTISYGVSSNGDTTPTTVGESLVYVTYENGTTYGSGYTTITISKKPLTLTATAQTVNTNGTFKAPSYTVKATAGKDVTTLPTGVTATAKITNGSGKTVELSEINENTKTAAVYTLTYDIAGADKDNYVITVNPASLTVKGKTSAAGDSTTGSGSDSSDSNGSDSSDGNGTDSSDSSSTVETPVAGTIDNPVTGATITDSNKIEDADGKTLKSQFAEIDGSLYYVNKSGKIVKGKVFTAKGGKTYYAKKDGTIAQGVGIKKIVGGKKVYAYEDGHLLVEASKVVNGKRIVADAKGFLVKSGYAVTAKGYVYSVKNYAATKVSKKQIVKAVDGYKYIVLASGKVAKDKVVTISGKKYVADKVGQVVINKKYTIKNKTYTTNKKGVITKTTTK
jgi:hypothetical protein